MYQYQKAQKPTEPLLSNYDAEWWADYINNHDLYDAQFSRMFKSFYYFNQSDDRENAIAEVTADFIDAVKIHLIMNAEKYRQLWRVLSVPDAENELYENVNGTETTTITFGKKTEYNRAEKKDTHEISNDAYTDNTKAENGKTHSVGETKIAGFNSTDYQPDKKTDTSNDAYTDSTTTNFGKTHGSTSDTYGAHIDSDADSGTEVTEYKRRGNIGVTTVSEMLKQHKAFWTTWEFYEYIFKAIAKDLLLVQ